MLRKINLLLSIILILLCITTFVEAGNFVTRAEEAWNTLTNRITDMIQKLVEELEKWLNKVDAHFLEISGALVFSAVLFIIGILLLCVLAPCVYIFTSCIETCTHCCTGNKETRRMKRNEKFKYFDERIAAMEAMNGIKTEIEIVEKDVEKKSGGKKKKGKKGASKVEKSVGVSVDGQEGKSVQKSM